MTDHSKPRVRLYIVGQATFRLTTRDRGYGGAYGQDRRPAKWTCITCGRVITGTDEKPSVYRKWSWSFNGDPGPWDDICARNGHSPCAHCGKQLPRTNDGCPRAHPWRKCPGKTEADRMITQHAHPGHTPRVKP